MTTRQQKRWIGVASLAVLVGCASPVVGTGSGASWGPGPAQIPAIAEQLATYDTLVVGTFDAQTQDDTTRSAARAFRWVLGAQLESLGVYPTVTRAAASNAKTLQVRGTVHHCRRDPPSSVSRAECKIDVTIRVCDGRTGQVLCWRSVESRSTATGFEYPEVLWGTATDVAHWLNALKEGRRPFIGAVRPFDEPTVKN